MLDAVDFGVIRIAADGKVSVTNEAHGRLQQALRTEERERRGPGLPRRRRHPAPRRRAAAGARAARRGLRRAGGLVRRGARAAPGAERHARAASPTPSGADAGAVVISRDVTTELDALRARDELVASVSHELRTPLTSILGYLDLAIEDPDIPDHVRSNLDIAERNAERLLGIVADILAASSSSSSSVEASIEPQDIDARDIVRAVGRGARRRAPPRARSRSTLTGLEAAPVSADPMRLRQVVDNLLSNAITYNRDGGTVFLGTTTDGTSSWILVRDTGVGHQRRRSVAPVPALLQGGRAAQRRHRSRPRDHARHRPRARRRSRPAQLAGRRLDLHRQASRDGRRPPTPRRRDHPVTLDLASVLVMTALVVNVSGILFIIETLLRRDEGAGRVWALAFLAGDADDARLHRVGAVARRVVGGRRRQRARSSAAPGACGSDAAASTAGGWRWPSALVAAAVLGGGGRRGGRRDRTAATGRERCGCSSRSSPSPASARWSASAAPCGSRARRGCSRRCSASSRCTTCRARRRSSPPAPTAPCSRARSAPCSTSFLTVTLTIVAVVVTSVLRAIAGADARLPAPRRARAIAPDGILDEDVFAAAMGDICERASRRSELVGVIAVRIDDLDQISTAFGSDVARAVTETWRDRRAPARARRTRSSPTTVRRGCSSACSSDSPAGRATRRRRDLPRTVRGSRPGRRGSDPGRRRRRRAERRRRATTQSALMRVAREAASRAAESVETSVLVGDDE